MDDARKMKLKDSELRINELAFNVLDENGAEVYGQDFPFNIKFDNTELIEFGNSMLECPIVVFKSYEDLFQTKTCEDAEIKATRMADGRIKNLVRNKLVQEIKLALEDNWLYKALTKIISSDDTPEEKTKRIKKTFKTVEDFQTFIRRNSSDGPVLLKNYIKSEPISEAYVCPAADTAIARIGEHVFHVYYYGGSPAGPIGGSKKSHTLLAGRTLEGAVGGDFISNLIEEEKNKKNWKDAIVGVGYSFDIKRDE